MKKITTIILAIVAIVLVCVLGFLIYVKVSFISKDEVKEIIADDMNLSQTDLYFESIDLEIKDGIYEVDLYYNNQEYEFKVDAKEGTVIYTDYQVTLTDNTNSTSDTTNDTTADNTVTGTSSITLDEAKEIALDHAGLTLSDVTFTKTKQDTDDGVQVYDIEFTYNGYEYEYEVLIGTGEIVSNSKEKINQ